jgi:hypothetical protein
MKPKRIVHIHGDTPIEEQWVEPTTSVSPVLPVLYPSVGEVVHDGFKNWAGGEGSEAGCYRGGNNGGNRGTPN